MSSAVAKCYATLVEVFNSMENRRTPHRGADYEADAGGTIVAYEECTVVNSDIKSNILGHCLVARRKRDGKYIGWAHVKVGTRPSRGTVLKAGASVGIVAGANDFHGSAWSGPHIHTTEGTTEEHIRFGQNTDPAPDIAAAVKASKVVQKPATKPAVTSKPATASKPVPLKHTVGPVVRSGSDWAYRRPTGALAKLVVKELKLKKRLPADYENDGNPGEVFDVAVQKTLNFSKIFQGDEDGVIKRGGCYGIQDYAKEHGGYKSKRDGRPEVISWEAFAKGLHG